MLMRRQNLIVNGKGHPIALVNERSVLVNPKHWNDRKMRGKVSELAGGARKQVRMPHEVYRELRGSLVCREELS